MSKVIAVFNQKGGVGKTTTNVNLTASLGTMGKKILVLDLDPQGNTTSGYGIDKQSVEKTIYDVIIEGVDINETILNTEFENIDIVAADTDLAGCEIEAVKISGCWCCDCDRCCWYGWSYGCALRLRSSRCSRWVSVSCASPLWYSPSGPSGLAGARSRASHRPEL